jgi:DNA-binding CsgD family transcriptional regulator
MADSDKVILQGLLTQAKITNRLLAAQLRAEMSQMDLVELLAGTGASRQEIADVLDTTAGTVGTTINRLRKKGKLGGIQNAGSVGTE